ncbi:MAG: DUF481 domain-containing protein [Pseudomonadota bacterium]
MKHPAAALLGAAMLAATSAAAQDAAPIPDIAQALLDAAYATGDASEIEAVTKAVKAVFPDYEIAVDEQSNEQIAALTPVEVETDEDGPPASEEASNGGVFALSPWDGKIETSALFSSGNSDNSAVGVLIDAARKDGKFVHNFDAFFNLGASEGILNQKRWGAAYKLDYNFGERTYAYGRFSYEEDEFSGFDYRLFAGAGLGHFLFRSDPFTWKVEGGPGFRYSPIDDTREIDQQFAAYAASETDWVIREGVLFEQDFAVTYTDITTTLQSVSSLSTKLWGSISTGVSFEYRRETNPPAGRQNTDTIAKAAVSYGF